MLNLRYVRDKLRKIWPGLPSGPAELRRALGEAVADVGRLTLATVLGYLLTVTLLPAPVDLTGALTALLVMQASLRGSFRAGMVRVVAVVTGIGIALVVATFVGLQWWSLAAVVFAALLAARVLRLEGASLETAISAMLILGSAGVDVAAFTRFATTVIGTVVGIGLPLLLPRHVRTADLTGGLRQVAARLQEVFSDASEHVGRRPMTKDAASRWLAASWQVAPLARAAETVFEEAADVQKWNTRQIFQADVVPLLRHGLGALERSLLSSAHLFQVMAAEAPSEATLDDGYGDDVRRELARVLHRLGTAMAAFADLVEADVLGSPSQAEVDLQRELDGVRESLNDLVSWMKVDPGQTGLWLLRGSIASAIEQILAEIDLARYLELRDDWRASQLGRALPTGAIGPRIRHPWSLLAQQRLRARAARSRLLHPEGSHEVGSDETTVLMPPVAS